MRKLIVFALIAGLAWFGYHKSQQAIAPKQDVAPQIAAPLAPANASSAPSGASAAFQCDGRTRCSQMHSCAEATYFIQHCPNTEMDGDGDGVPCEKQWCGR